jgi:hypothetical protein
MKHFRSIKNRTTQPSVNGWENYGAKGITLAEEWLADPMSFVDYMRSTYRPGLTIDRIDNARGYEPGNLRWATAKEQTVNRSTTIKVEWDDKQMSFANFAREHTDLSVSQALTLWHKGWSLEQLVAHEPKLIGARVRLVKRRAETQV